MALLGAPELASPDEAEQLIQCLEDETLMRLFLTGLIGQAGTLSEETSECIRGGFSGFDLRSMMLSSAAGGDEDTGMAGGMAAFVLTLSCLDEDEWAAAAPALDIAPGDRETLQCVLEALGGPEGVAASLQPAGGGPPAAFFEAAMDAGCRMKVGDPQLSRCQPLPRKPRKQRRSQRPEARPESRRKSDRPVTPTVRSSRSPSARSTAAGYGRTGASSAGV